MIARDALDSVHIEAFTRVEVQIFGVVLLTSIFVESDCCSTPCRSYTMGPKPFPYPIGVGVDICQFTRLYQTLGHDSEKVTRWARKVFARREWPILHQKFYRASDNQTRSDSFPASLWLPQVKPIKQLGKATANSHTEITYSFPKLKPGQDEATLEHDASDPMAALDAGLVTGAQSMAKGPLPSPLSVSHQKFHSLAQSLAGRFVSMFSSSR